MAKYSKEQIIRITAEQQEKEIASIRKSNLETRLLRHDMRLLRRARYDRYSRGNPCDNNLGDNRR